MPKAARLDQEMVRRGLVPSRAEAGRAIGAGKVIVKGMPADRASTMVLPQDPIAITKEASRFVSRGGEKLRGALDRFRIDPSGRRWLDAGASTGGFTDCLLQSGAEAVVSADVGYGQLHWRLREDPRVSIVERMNLRNLKPGALPWTPDGIVADLSFISLTSVLPALTNVLSGTGEMVLLVKPQFEAGRAGIGKRGVVTDPSIRERALQKVADSAAGLGLAVTDACASPIKGPAGNVEYFLHCVRGIDPQLNQDALGDAVAQGERL